MKIYLILPLLVASCSLLKPAPTPVYRLAEPGRSQLFVSCLMGNINVTDCECLEEKAVKESGVTSLEDPASLQKFQTVAEALVAKKECGLEQAAPEKDVHQP